MFTDKLGPGGIITPTLAPTFINGQPVDAVISAIDDRAGGLSSTKPSSEARFWASNQRPQASTIIEVFEVSISSARTINALQFSLARFPQVASVQYLDPAEGEWTDALDRHGFPVLLRFTDSLPAQIAPQILQQGAPHPQHYGAGHWVPFDVDITPVTAARFRVLLKRADGVPPKDPFGNSLDYSLGVKDFNLGFRITSLSDVPHRPVSDDHLGERAPFAQGIDVLGSPIELSIKENRPYELLRDRVWRSSPQPVQNAVVNLYIDARDAYGEAQVVDRFYVDPITSGVHANLYYSNDSAAPVAFRSLDVPLGSPITVPVGVVTPDPALGLVFEPATPGILSIDNSGVQWDPSRPWSIGIEFIPNFGSDDTSDYTLLDCGVLSIAYSNGFFNVLFGGAMSATMETNFTAGNPVTLLVNFDGQSLALDTDYASTSVSGSVGVSYPPAPMLYLGGNYDLSDLFDGAIRTFILKALVPDPDPTGFIASPRDYAVLPEYMYLDSHQTDNALIRIHPDNQSGGLGTVNAYGVEGGPANTMEHLTWTPISRSFVLHRGYMSFDPIKAKRFKFEFTSLAPELFETSVPVVQSVKTLPKKIRSVGLLSAPSESLSSTGTISVHSDVAGAFNEWADSSRITFLNRVNVIRAFTPTEALKAEDPQLAKRLNDASLYFNLLPWQHGSEQVRWNTTTTHQYEEIEIEHTKRIAFFVALSKLIMYRVDYEAEDDTPQYLELFHDDAFIESSNFARGINQIFTPEAVNQSMATSTTFASKRRVRGIQFATQQSPPIQLLSDPDFRDPELDTWAAYGTAVIEPETLSSSDIGTSVVITRTQRNATWEEVEAAYGSTTVRIFAVTLTDTGDLVSADEHGLADDDIITFASIVGTTGITAGTPYYVISATTDTFQVSATQGGSALALTTDGTADVHQTQVHTWQEIEDTNQTWYSMEHEGVIGEAYGGITGTEVVSVSERGRVYGAARVFSEVDLSSPVYLQIVSETGDVLAESAASPLAGQITEWVVEYTIGEGGQTSTRTWAEVESLSPPTQVAFADSGDLITAPSHGFSNDDPVVFTSIFDTTGITVDTTYYVISAATDTFQVSLTVGGGAIALTTDGSGVAVATVGNTWQDLQDFGTWRDVSEETDSLDTNIYPRLIQKSETEERWSVYNISLFDDVIVWEFSNDGGTTWYPAYDIRNNPDGAMLFPDFDDTSIDTVRGKQLRWRVSAYAPNVRISSLAIRPLYSERTLGIPYRDDFQGSGPNLSMQDDYADIHNDPRWSLWNKPVPESWYYDFRRYLLLDGNRTLDVPPPPPNDHTTDGTDPNEPPDPIGGTPEAEDITYPFFVYTFSNTIADEGGPAELYPVEDIEGIVD